LDKEAAVGLLRRSAAALLALLFLVEGGGCEGALRDLAKEAAVGANRLEGVLGRDTELGVFGREGVLARGGLVTEVLARDVFEGVDGAVRVTAGLRVEELFEVVDWPVCCGFRGVAEDMLEDRGVDRVAADFVLARREDDGGDFDSGAVSFDGLGVAGMG
jgi:hypothetical protein